MSWLKQPKKKKTISLECRKQCLKTIRNQAWPPPLKKEKDKVYNQTHVSHLLFLSNYPKRVMPRSTIKITPKSSKATKKPMSSHVRGDLGFPTFLLIKNHNRHVVVFCHWMVFGPFKGRGLVSPQHVQGPKSNIRFSFLCMYISIENKVG